MTYPASYSQLRGGDVGVEMLPWGGEHSHKKVPGRQLHLDCKVPDQASQVSRVSSFSRKSISLFITPRKTMLHCLTSLFILETFPLRNPEIIHLIVSVVLTKIYKGFLPLIKVEPWWCQESMRGSIVKKGWSAFSGVLACSLCPPELRHPPRLPAKNGPLCSQQTSLFYLHLKHLVAASSWAA